MTKEDNTRWFQKMRKNLFIKNSIYFGRLCHHRDLHGTPLHIPDDGIVCRNILNSLKTNSFSFFDVLVISSFVKKKLFGDTESSDRITLKYGIEK
jgi:hypothetical protein